MQVLLISLFGVIGVLSRHFADVIFNPNGDRGIPTTLGVNILGCAIAAVLYDFSRRKAFLPPNVIQALMVGFCGGFTTFSAYAMQTFSMIESGKFATAALYCFLSPLAGVLAIGTVLAVLKQIQF